MGSLFLGKQIKKTAESAADNDVLPLAGMAVKAAVDPKKKKSLRSPLAATILDSGTGVDPLTNTLS